MGCAHHNMTEESIKDFQTEYNHHSSKKPEFDVNYKKSIDIYLKSLLELEKESQKCFQSMNF